MMLIHVASIVAFLVAHAFADPITRNTTVLERRHSIPRGFVLRGPAPKNTTINLRIALTQNDVVGLEKALYDVSTPGSSLYGKHLSKEEVEEFIRPSSGSVAKVHDWLKASGLTPKTISPAGDWISVSASVGQANSLLDAEFSTFHNEETGITAIRTLSYSIPNELQEHIAVVHPTVTFPGRRRRPAFSFPSVLKPRKLHIPAPSSCDKITPACLQQLYGIPSTPASVASNQIAVSGFINEYANEADLTKFLTTLRPDIPSNTTWTLQEIDGGNNLQNITLAGSEADLNVQYTIGVATGVPVTFISVGDDVQDGDLDGFLDLINFLLGEPKPPQVLTTSYGQDEDEVSQKLAIQACNAYMQLGARGISILFASGDSGVGSSGSSCTTFVPQFPSDCPFITSVGATQFIPESASDLSSGGFSNYFAQPSYQVSAVSKYLANLGGQLSGLYNASGRAFPDVSAMGNEVEFVNQGRIGSTGGTSCSSPIFASVIGLLNDELAQAGRPPLGFLNPFLYGPGASAFNDITAGENPGCNTGGFSATTGWDPVTGLGSPNYTALRAAVGL